MKYIYFIVPITLLLFIWISFFYEDSKDEVKNKDRENAFSRGTVQSKSQSKNGQSSKRSLFEEDSKFLEFKDFGDIEEVDSSTLTPTERERRKKLIIQKSKKLADRFPNNSVIPRELSKEEEEKATQIKLKMATVQSQYLENEKVSKEDRLFYYKERLKTSKDRLEIFRYALSQQNGGVFDETKLDGFLKERYDLFLENERAYSDEISKVEKE